MLHFEGRKELHEYQVMRVIQLAKEPGMTLQVVYPGKKIFKNIMTIEKDRNGQGTNTLLKVVHDPFKKEYNIAVRISSRRIVLIKVGQTEADWQEYFSFLDRDVKYVEIDKEGKSCSIVDFMFSKLDEPGRRFIWALLSTENSPEAGSKISFYDMNPEVYQRSYRAVDQTLLIVDSGPSGRRYKMKRVFYDQSLGTLLVVGIACVKNERNEKKLFVMVQSWQVEHESSKSKGSRWNFSQQETREEEVQLAKFDSINEEDFEVKVESTGQSAIAAFLFIYVPHTNFLLSLFLTKQKKDDIQRPKIPIMKTDLTKGK